jgi:hypothetical protein
MWIENIRTGMIRDLDGGKHPECNTRALFERVNSIRLALNFVAIIENDKTI